MTEDVSKISLSAIVSEVNLVGSNPREWWVNTDSTRHACLNRVLFTTFEPLDGEKVFMAILLLLRLRDRGRCC